MSMVGLISRRLPDPKHQSTFKDKPVCMVRLAKGDIKTVPWHNIEQVHGKDGYQISIY